MEVSVWCTLRELRMYLQPRFLGLHYKQWSRCGLDPTASLLPLVVLFSPRKTPLIALHGLHTSAPFHPDSHPVLSVYFILS